MDPLPVEMAPFDLVDIHTLERLNSVAPPIGVISLGLAAALVHEFVFVESLSGGHECLAIGLVPQRSGFVSSD